MEAPLGNTSISYSFSIVIAISIELILYITFKVQTAKYSRTRILNKLTLIPFYSISAYLGLALLQVILLLEAKHTDAN